MDSIRSAAVSLCIALVAAGIFSMLTPSGSWNRFARFGVQLFLLLSLASPFFSGELNWTMETGELLEEADSARTEMSALAEEQLLENFSENLEQSARDVLENAGFSPLEIEAWVHSADEQRIDISELNITLPEEEKSRGDQASQLIAEAFGTEPQLTFSGQTGGKNSGE